MAEKPQQQKGPGAGGADAPGCTPGPWCISGEYAAHLYILPAEDAGKSAGASFVSEQEHREKYFRTIAMVDRKPYCFDGISRDENASNVRLMAAAPDLYAALSLYVEHFGDPLKVARAALAKADGQEDKQDG